jgi:two-component system, chemotaxis family, response regulator Rcp1
MERMNALESPIEVLLVEDSPGDVRLTREAFRDAKMHIHLSVVSDGAAAVAYLHREGEYANAPRPDLILLDLNLPKKDGREVLAEIKGSQELRSIPVFIVTTSSNEDDVLQSYHLHANCYITKPVDLDGFLRVVRSIDSFWLTVVKLPPQEARMQPTVMAGEATRSEGTT